MPLREIIITYAYWHGGQNPAYGLPQHHIYSLVQRIVYAIFSIIYSYPF